MKMIWQYILNFLYWIFGKKTSNKTNWMPISLPDDDEPEIRRAPKKHNNRKRTPGRIIQEIKMSPTRSKFVRHA